MPHSGKTRKPKRISPPRYTTHESMNKLFAWTTYTCVKVSPSLPLFRLRRQPLMSTRSATTAVCLVCSGAVM